LALRCLIQKYFKRETTKYEEAAASKMRVILKDEDPANELFSLMYGSSNTWTKESGKKKPLFVQILEQNMTATYEECLEYVNSQPEDTTESTGNDTTIGCTEAYERLTSPMSNGYHHEVEGWRPSAK